MTANTVQLFALSFLTVLCTAQAQANPQSQDIELTVYPYIASLTENAIEIEKVLIEKSIEVCGSLEQVLYIKDINFKSRKTYTNEVLIKPHGKIGDTQGNAILTFAYPRVDVSARITCKETL